jgi:hypothetical protein
VGRDSVATRYGLEGPGIEARGEGGEIFLARPDRHWSPPSLLYNEYQVTFSGVKRQRDGVYHWPHLGPKSKVRAIPLLPLWTVMACSRVNFFLCLFFFLSVYYCCFLLLLKDVRKFNVELLLPPWLCITVRTRTGRVHWPNTIIGDIDNLQTVKIKPLAYCVQMSQVGVTMLYYKERVNSDFPNILYFKVKD